MYVEDVSHSQALSVFQKQFRSKTGQPWENRADAHGGPKRYAFLERNYEEAEEEDADEDAGGSAGGEAAKLVKSSLAKPLQNLMQLIFNTDIMYVVSTPLVFLTQAFQNISNLFPKATIHGVYVL